MSLTLADATLGLSAQSLAVLHLLAQTPPDDVAEYDSDHRDYDVEIKTRAWYNGRERGVSLEVRKSWQSSKALIITFGEHRISDHIFVDAWEIDAPPLLNPPTVADFPDKAFNNRLTFPYGEIGKVVDLIRARMKVFLASTEKSRPRPTMVLPEIGEEIYPQ
jgi:hypothetical protein